MKDGERRNLVFANLLNGIRVEQIMTTFRMSAKEVMDDFAFIARKIRSYRFERGMPFLPCDTVENAKASRAALLFTLTRINPDTEPRFSRVETLNFDPTIGSPGSQKIFEIAATRRG